MFNATMDFGLGEDIDALRETVRKFALEEIAPKSAEVDRSNDFPMELWEMMGNLGHMERTRICVLTKFIDGETSSKKINIYQN